MLIGGECHSPDTSDQSVVSTVLIVEVGATLEQVRGSELPGDCERFTLQRINDLGHSLLVLVPVDLLHRTVDRYVGR